ncbi:hypothetical protein [Neomegalonema perideroedes]|uniref:hypothetical protein n=1 Tax=Neomegalonema perideroedes TaxID=217219 RepID=UPI000365EA73|nr:hypothetical protein [Neomegalonema perideroedes]
MPQAYVGFYWTLPVPWAGFKTLPKDPVEAAAASLTIRYQRDLARRWAQDHNGVVIHEKALMEMEPDRGSPEVAAEAARLLLWARAHEARLLLVDFASEGGWRAHAPLRHAVAEVLARDPERAEHLRPDAIPLEGRPRIFDPQEHFREWRAAQKRRTASKPEHRALILSHLEGLRGMTRAEQAKALAEAGLTTFAGGEWKAANLGKFLAVGRAEQAAGPGSLIPPR